MPRVDPNSVGSRGEKLVDLRLTSLKNPDGSRRSKPIFKPAMLGEKFPRIDFYVEVDVPGRLRPFFLVQVKTTLYRRNAVSFGVNRKKVAQLLAYRAPCYVAFVQLKNDDSGVIFLKATWGTAPKSAYKIAECVKLTNRALETLKREVHEFWRSQTMVPLKSAFK